MNGTQYVAAGLLIRPSINTAQQNPKEAETILYNSNPFKSIRFLHRRCGQDEFLSSMDFLLNTQRDSVSNALLMNNSSSSSDPSAYQFGFHSEENPQLPDGSLQLHQKKKKRPADNERSPEETQGFMISGNGTAKEVRRRAVSASMSTDFKFAEATAVTTTELRSPPSVNLGTPASLSVNGGGTAKVGKKRSRASRRAPTTLLNTDTSNFRAMVQRFTGIPETPFGYSSMNPTFSPHVGQQDWQLVGKPLPYKAVLDLNMNCVSHPNSALDGYRPQQYNSTTFLPFQSLHDCINMGSPLNLLPKAPQGQPSNASLLNDVGLINSASVFPNPALTLSSDRRPAYLL